MAYISSRASVLAGAVSSLALLLPHAVAAQEESTTQLQAVVVEGQGEGEASAGSGIGPVKGVVAKDTRLGAKTATDVTAIPQAVSVIGREEMDAQGVQKADEALRYTSGVFTQPFGTDSDTNWMFIRGFQATAAGTYLDGLQLYSFAFGAFYIDSFGLERVEVLKGAASVLYGGTNPGGMVNYVSKRPVFETKRTVEAGINDAGNAYLGFDVNDLADDAVAYRINGRIAGGDTYSDFQDGWRGFVSPSITWKPDEGTSLTLLGNYSHIDESHGGGGFLPYEGTVVDRVVGGVNYGRIRPDFNATEPGVDSYEREQGSIGYEFEHTFDNDWTVRSSLRYGAADIRETNLYPSGWATADELTRIDWTHHSRISSLLADNQIEGKVETGDVEHTILAGIDYKYYNIDHVQASSVFGSTPTINPFDPDYGQPLTPRLTYTDQDLTLKSIGLYAQDQIRFGDGWLVTLNGRYDRYTLETIDGPTDYVAATTRNERSGGALSGRAGLAYEFDNGLTPYASAATFFNPQVGTLANGDLFEPEEGTQYEVGIKYRPTFVDGLFTVALFDLTRENVAVAHPTIPFAQTQTGEVRSRGVELEGKVNVTEDFRVTAALTALDLEITRDTDPTVVGKTPFIVPDVMASASAEYTLRGDGWYDGVTIGGGVRYLGSSWADNQNTRKVPSATLADAKIGYKKDNWGIDFNVTNLFDKTYVSSCQGVDVCSYGEGRTFKLKAHVTW
ncbi:TonB-dependent siderophore receptor [Shinella pollutisoli]|uniref:TonB-dependent siderophore receptor n=1 Tax=Shinella pollutisoli TaxID=2250594 RepID=A0ABV7DMB2_9HYPH|nr:TonB-dependent siderophore receptor [Shinella pollutisoli]